MLHCCMNYMRSSGNNLYPIKFRKSPSPHQHSRSLLVFVAIFLLARACMAQSSCMLNPQYDFCCDPEIDICKPRTAQVKYGVTAGDLCVNGYPPPQSCNGAFSWGANFSSASESIEWRKNFVSKYWSDAAYEQCAPLEARPNDGSWSGNEQDLKIGTLQWSDWKTILFYKGAPPQGGNMTCDYQRELPQSFNVVRYLVEDNCEEGFVPGRLKTDDTRVCTKKIPLEISINGPSFSLTLPSDAGPVLQTISVRREGAPAKNIPVQISMQEAGSSTIQNSSGATDANGDYKFLYVPPFLKATSVKLIANCSACVNPVKKEIAVLSNELKNQSNACRREDF